MKVFLEFTSFESGRMFSIDAECIAAVYERESGSAIATYSNTLCQLFPIREDYDFVMLRRSAALDAANSYKKKLPSWVQTDQQLPAIEGDKES